MNYHIEATLNYIDKRLAELNAELYGDGTEEGDAFALMNQLVTDSYAVEALTEERTLSTIRGMLLNGAEQKTVVAYPVGDHMSLHELSEKIKKAVEEVKGELP